MRCPFLEQAQVTYCRTSVVRKMIVRTPETLAAERCSSPAYHDCASYREHRCGLAGLAASNVCPFLEPALVEYCAAAPVRKYVPASDPRLSRCAGDRYRYCEVYLRGSGPAARAEAAQHVVHGLRAPNWLFYSANHMWLDRAGDGTCHLGVDALLARLLGPLERVSFVTCQGVERPTAVLTAHDVDVQMVFPNLVAVTAPNHALRGNPAQLTADPYWLGWLFEGADADCSGLIPGAEARVWMTRELERLSEAVRGSALWRSLPDGGELDPRLLDRLDREERFRLLHEFSSPYASWKKPS